MFLHLSVILFTGGVSASVHAGIHPWEGTPPWQVYTPLGRYSPAGTPHWVGTPPTRCTPPRRSLQRTVRILLECFLVTDKCSEYKIKIKDCGIRTVTGFFLRLISEINCTWHRLPPLGTCHSEESPKNLVLI